MNILISIEYCTSWGYLDEAVSLTQKLLKEHKNKIMELSLIPSSGGVFEVKFNDELIFSKAKEGRKPGLGEVESMVRSQMGIEAPFGL